MTATSYKKSTEPTEKQYAYIRGLISQLVDAGHSEEELRHSVGDLHTKKQASGAIKFLLDLNAPRD